jgi:hypothetical protein
MANPHPLPRYLEIEQLSHGLTRPIKWILPPELPLGSGHSQGKRLA